MQLRDNDMIFPFHLSVRDKEERGTIKSAKALDHVDLGLQSHTSIIAKWCGGDRPSGVSLALWRPEKFP